MSIETIQKTITKSKITLESIFENIKKGDLPTSDEKNEIIHILKDLDEMSSYTTYQYIWLPIIEYVVQNSEAKWSEYVTPSNIENILESLLHDLGVYKTPGVAVKITPTINEHSELPFVVYVNPFNNNIEFKLGVEKIVDRLHSIVTTTIMDNREIIDNYRNSNKLTSVHSPGKIISMWLLAMIGWDISKIYSAAKYMDVSNIDQDKKYQAIYNSYAVMIYITILMREDYECPFNKILTQLQNKRGVI